MSDRSQWTGWHSWWERTELSNTGHKMDNEIIITHILISLPQSEYEGAILFFKDKLRKGKVYLPEIQQILEDKYQSMKHVKGWDKVEDDYALLTSHSNKNKPKKQFKGIVHKDMSKIKCYNCGEYGHSAHDCPKPCDNANTAQENERNKKFENMLDLDNSSVNKECAMMCTDVHCEDGDEDIIMYRDQGVSTEEHNETMYSELTKTQREEDTANYNVVLCANDSVSLEKKRRWLNENTPEENIYNLGQSDVSINENTTVNSFNGKCSK